MKLYALLASALLVVPSAGLVAGLVVGLVGCERGPPEVRAAIGDEERGKLLTTTYGCQACHVIPGIEGATATVGPPLDRFALRRYAGGLLNTPSNLVRFLVDPPAVTPGSPMPSVGLDEVDARDIAAFLYTLR
jgi:cytochrome c